MFQETYLKLGGTNKPLDTTVCRMPAHHKLQRLVHSYLGGGGTPLGTLKHRPATQEKSVQQNLLKQHCSTAVAIMLGFQLYWQRYLTEWSSALTQQHAPTFTPLLTDISMTLKSSSSGCACILFCLQQTTTLYPCVLLWPNNAFQDSNYPSYWASRTLSERYRQPEEIPLLFYKSENPKSDENCTMSLSRIVVWILP
jgi:hypothetical protein